MTYPGNDWDIQRNITLRPLSSLTLQFGTDALHRISSRDAVYEPPGVRLIRGTGQGNHVIAAQSFIKVIWRPSERCELLASYIHASIGSLVKDRGGRDAEYGAIQISVKL